VMLWGWQPAAWAKPLSAIRHAANTQVLIRKRAQRKAAARLQAEKSDVIKCPQAAPAASN